MVYLPPRDSDGAFQVALDELERDVLGMMGKGRIVILGDFNARVGELPNRINSLDDLGDASLCISRTSEDKTVKSEGYY